MAFKISLATIKNQYPGGTQPDKQITGFRSILNNMDTLFSNYNLDGGLNFSDVYGRMYFKEFAQWILEPRRADVTIKLKQGFFKGVKLFTVLKGEGIISKKTRVLTLGRGGVKDAVRDIVQDHVREAINGS